MNKLKLIIKREFLAKVRNKSFIIMTFLSPLLIVGITLLVSYLTSLKSDVKIIAIHDKSGIFISEFKNSDEFRYNNLTGVAIAKIKESINNKSYEGLIYFPDNENLNDLQTKIQYISNESPDSGFINTIETKVAKKITQINFQNAKIDTLSIQKAMSKVNINLKKANGDTALKGLNEIKAFIGGAFGYLIMMFIIIYGNMVMRSVIEEKTNRIIEIIISSVKPYQLMMGKIIGTSLAGILQFIIWAIVGGALMIGASVFFGINATPTARVSPEMMAAAQNQFTTSIPLYIKELQSLPVFTILFGFITYFIGGFFLYSSFYAAIGAAVDNETDSQQFLMPIITPLMLGVYIGFFSVLNDPHGTIATVFSIVPLTSPIVMLMRLPFGVPWWQIALSITVLFGTFFGVVWFASKIYRIGILMYGKKPSWKELYKWLRY